jgi:hypothetical protein
MQNKITALAFVSGRWYSNTNEPKQQNPTHVIVKVYGCVCVLVVWYRYVSFSTQLVGLIKQVQGSDMEGREQVAAILKCAVAQVSMRD